MYDILTEALRSHPAFKQIKQHLNLKQSFGITGLSHIHKVNMILALRNVKKCGVFVLASDEIECTRLSEDLEKFGVNCLIYPERDLTLTNVESVSREFEHKRLHVLWQILNNKFDCILCTAESAALYTITPQCLKNRTLSLKLGDSISPKQAASALVKAGYIKCDQVDGIGLFSVRGGIIDFFSPAHEHPVRIELWGNDIDTISFFDIGTQRRTLKCKEALITPVTEVFFDEAEIFISKLEKLKASLTGKYSPLQKKTLESEISAINENRFIASYDKFLPIIYEEKCTLFNYISDSLLFVSEPVKVKSAHKGYTFHQNEEIKEFLKSGVLCKGLTEFSLPYEIICNYFEEKNVVYLDVFAHASYPSKVDGLINLKANTSPFWSGELSFLIEELTDTLKSGNTVLLLAGTDKNAKNITGDLQKANINAVYDTDPAKLLKGTIIVSPGGISSGFNYPDIGFEVMTYSSASNIAKRRKTRHKTKDAGEIFNNLSELVPGCYVVHSIYGIGIFEGINKIEMDDITKDYIKIKYDKNDVLYVPVIQLDLISKYIGTKEDVKLKLHKLGGTEWQKSRSRVSKAVKDMAKELIEVYSKRLASKGYAFAPDDDFEAEFEQRFEYYETDDQIKCIEEIKKDMQQPYPMDRLLCGDVGFGKTEVALRAAFKCVNNGKQCAILVPTTLLALQHFQTITKRMDGFPVNVEILSRYRTPKQQREIIKKLHKGSIDVVVGTHRIIQKDIAFKDLGLVIVDEEQRFGVVHKERLKSLFKSVDYLTLSATPIPRTLNMAFSGIRDMSVIEEAPGDRRPVQTYVLEYSEPIVIDAIKKELSRGGQVYYLHNRVENIEHTAYKLHTALPEAKIAVAHGKMSQEELSEVWRQLLEQEIDILVCTTIIETGVDVPNVNTLIIENADRMGLSQLHQLRGRVGRSSRRAYAYFTFLRGKVLSEISTKRLNTIREYTEFGSGFKIAMRDLEIRGAGNILGGEQHGHIESVGYDMYFKLLNNAVNEQKGIKVKEPSECVLDIRVDAHIPENYIKTTGQRINIYRRISEIATEENRMDVLDELIDRFGEPPKSVVMLTLIALLRNTAASFLITDIIEKNGALLFHFKKIDLETTSLVISKLGRRAMFNAGAKPYLHVKMNTNQSVIDCLNEVLSSMQKD